jgi:hypothetical protein
VKANLRLRVLLPVAILALMGVGFGAFAFTGTPGGDEPLPPIKRPAVAKPAKGTSLARWAKDANRICRALNVEARALGTPQTRNDLLQLLPQSLTLAESALADLRKLETPPRGRKRIGRMLRHFDRFVALERDAVTSLTANDIESFARLTAQAFAQNDRGNEIARSLGAGRCAVGGTDDTSLARELERHRVVVGVLHSPGANLDALALREARSGAALARAGFVAIDVYDTKEIAPVAAQYAVRGAPSVFVFVRGRGAVTQFEGWVDSETVAQAVDNARL